MMGGFTKHNLPDGSIVVGEKFLVGRTLGEGSFGQIQLGTNIETGDFVAIKIVCRVLLSYK
jgi:serine/threonine protein kinase